MSLGKCSTRVYKYDFFLYSIDTIYELCNIDSFAMIMESKNSTIKYHLVSFPLLHLGHQG